MDLDDLTAAAHAFLAGRGKHEPDLSDPETAWGRCVIETERFAESTGDPQVMLVRVTGQNYPGREHWAAVAWNEDAPEDSPVVDITARQFSADAPLPWTGTLIDFYDDACDWLNDWIHVEVRDPRIVKPMAGERYEDGLVFDDDYARDDHEPGDVTYPWQMSTR